MSDLLRWVRKFREWLRAGREHELAALLAARRANERRLEEIIARGVRAALNKPSPTEPSP